MNALPRQHPEIHRGYPPGSTEYRRITWSLFAAGLATFASIYVTQPLLPTLSAHFGVTPTASALTVTLSTGALGVTLVFLGPAGEVFGRTQILHFSLAATAIVTLLSSIVPTWPLLLLSRVLLGMSAAALPAVAIAYLREEISPAAVSTATGLYIGGTAMGGMLGRLLTSAVAQVAGWRPAIAVVGLVGVACAIVVRLMLPHSKGFRPTEPHPKVLLRQWWTMVRDPQLFTLYLMAGLMMGGFVAVFNATGYYLESNTFMLSVGTAGLVYSVYAFGTWSSTRAGTLADRHGAPWVVIATIALTLCGLGITAVSLLDAERLIRLVSVVTGLGLLTAGFFAFHGVASGWVTARAAHLGNASHDNHRAEGTEGSQSTRETNVVNTKESAIEARLTSEAGTARRGGTGQAAALYTLFYYTGSAIAGVAVGHPWTSGGWSAVIVFVGSLFGVSLITAGAAAKIHHDQHSR